MLGSIKGKAPHIVMIFLALLVCVLFWAKANGKDVELKSTVSIDSITLGDEILYTLVIESKPGINLDSAKLDLDLSPFQVKERRSYLPVRDKKGNALQKQEYIITIFDLGSSIIPPARVEYRDSQNQLTLAFSDSITINVKSIGLPQDARDIKNLKPPFKIKEKNRWYLYLLLAIVAGGILTWVYLHWRIKGTGFPQTRLEKEKPAWLVALALLEELKSSNYLKQREIKKYYIVLSQIIRDYLESRFNIPAVDRTTSEIRWEMKKNKIEQQIVQRVIDLLSECDLVKFAKFIPSIQQTEEDWRESHDLVQDTKIKEIQPIEVEK